MVLWVYCVIVLCFFGFVVSWFRKIPSFHFMFSGGIDPISKIFKIVLRGSSSFFSARLFQSWFKVSIVLIFPNSMFIKNDMFENIPIFLICFEVVGSMDSSFGSRTIELLRSASGTKCWVLSNICSSRRRS